MALRPAAANRSSTSNDVFLSAVQPNTLPPSMSGATDRSVRPRRRVCMKFLLDTEKDNVRSGLWERAESDTFWCGPSWVAALPGGISRVEPRGKTASSRERDLAKREVVR